MTIFCIIVSKACKLIGIIESPKMLNISFVETYLCYIKHSQLSLLTVTRMEMVQAANVKTGHTFINLTN